MAYELPAHTPEYFMPPRPLVSVLTAAYRPGGLDITLAGLRDQTYRDFEVIICDRRYERRHAEVVKLAIDYNVMALHVPEHRRNGDWIVAAAAWNTAIALARGRYVLFLQDYTWVPPTWIEAMLAPLQGHPRRYVVGSSDSYPMLPTTNSRIYQQETVPAHLEHAIPDHVRPTMALDDTAFDELVIWKDGPFDPRWIVSRPDYFGSQLKVDDSRRTVIADGTMVNETFLCVKNEAVERELILEVNGMDERFDLTKGPFDLGFGINLINAGAELFWHDTGDPQVVVNPRSVFRTRPYGANQERVAGRWNLNDGLDYCNLIRYRESRRANNPFEIRELAVELHPWRFPGALRAPRELEDLSYFRQPISPMSLPVKTRSPDHEPV